jgi:hypothetical protein
MLLVQLLLVRLVAYKAATAAADKAAAAAADKAAAAAADKAAMAAAEKVATGAAADKAATAAAHKAATDAAHKAATAAAHKAASVAALKLLRGGRGVLPMKLLYGHWSCSMAHSYIANGAVARLMELMMEPIELLHFRMSCFTADGAVAWTDRAVQRPMDMLQDR